MGGKRYKEKHELIYTILNNEYVRMESHYFMHGRILYPVKTLHTNKIKPGKHVFLCNGIPFKTFYSIGKLKYFLWHSFYTEMHYYSTFDSKKVEYQYTPLTR